MTEKEQMQEKTTSVADSKESQQGNEKLSLLEQVQSPKASTVKDKDTIKNYSDQLEASLGFPRFWTSASEEQHHQAAEILKKELALDADLAIEDLAGRMNKYRLQFFGITMYHELWSTFFDNASAKDRERMEGISNRWTAGSSQFMGDYVGRSAGELYLRRYNPSYQFFNSKY